MTARGYQGHLKRGDTLNEDLDQMTEEREHYQEGLGRSLSSQVRDRGREAEIEGPLAFVRVLNRQGGGARERG